MSKKKKIISFIKFDVILTIIFGIITTIFFLSIGFSNIEKQKEIIEEDELLNVEILENILDERFHDIYIDLLYFTDLVRYADLDNLEEYQRVSKMAYNFLNRSRMYDNIVYADNSGNEKMKIIHNLETGSYIYKENELKNIATTNYFKSAMSLPMNTLYLSALDLATDENGKVIEPFVPIMGFAMQIYKNDEKAGVLIFRYRAGKTIDEIRQFTSDSNGELYMLDEAGYWIIDNKGEDKSWGYMFKDKQDISFSKTFPTEFYRITHENEDQFYTENGLFTRKNPVLQSFVSLYINHGINTYNERFRIVGYIPPGDKFVFINNTKLKMALGIMKNNYNTYIFIIVITIFISLLLSNNKVSKATRNYNSNHDFMTNTFTRSTGTQIISKMLEIRKEKDIKTTLLFLDINGLKQINSILGEIVGDEAIVKTIKTIKKKVPKKTNIIRYVGDEFIVILEEMNIEESKIIWENISNEFDKINKATKKGYRISVSVGFVDLNKFDTSQSAIDVARKEMEKNKKIITKK